MSKEITVKLLEIDAEKLKQGGKHVFMVEEHAATNEALDMMYQEFERLFGSENFTILVLNGVDAVKVYSVEK